MVSTDTIFWTQIGSFFGFLVTIFGLYRLLVAQKDATIQVLNEKISYLKDQLADAKAQSPDLLAQSLSGRVKLLEEELKRLEENKSSTEDQVKEKEAELHTARMEAEKLTKQVLHAKELLSEFLCPYCGSSLASKVYDTESVEYDGREIDVDHEYSSFNCGYVLIDGKAVQQCKTVKANQIL